jgi:2-polyprenyl-3-methyl-5-hydroxy-6-metoxy-1,4-benzoquinol methylase
MIAFLHKWALSFTRRVLNKLTDKELLEVLVDAAKTRAESLPPTEGLRFLFGLDAALYPVQGWLSVAYDGGVHTKHRHTRYHDFFVNRIAAGERVLDVGCGIGALAYDVAAKAGARVVGMDLSSQNIVTAAGKHSHPHVTYLVGDVLRSPLKGLFDTVVLSNVVEHLEHRPEFLKGVIHAVQPSRLLLRVPVFERDWRVPLKKELGIDYRLDPTHFTEYTLESFAAEMDQARLKITHQEVRWGEIWAEAVPM